MVHTEQRSIFATWVCLIPQFPGVCWVVTEWKKDPSPDSESSDTVG